MRHTSGLRIGNLLRGSKALGATSRPRHFSAKPPMPLYAECWVKAVAKNGSRSALVFDGNGPAVDITFDELESKVNRLTRNLRAIYSVEPGDLIVTVAENRPELITLMLSCQKLGAAFVPLAADLSKKDCRSIVNMYEPKLVISDRPQHTEFPREDGQGTWPTMLLPAYRDADGELLKLESQGSDEPAQITANGDDPGIIFSTSGSTGLPKGVVYSNSVVGLFGNITALLKAQGAPPFTDLGPGDSSLLWVPIRGVGATLASAMFLVDGIQQVMVEPRKPGLSDALDWAPLIDKYNVRQNILFGAAMNQFVQTFPDRAFPSVTEVIYGGSCFPPSLITKSMEQFPNATFKQGYAMTECFPISELLPVEHKRGKELTKNDLRILASAGKPHAMGKMFIEDLSQEFSGKPPPPEKKGVGQVCAWSPFMMKEYYKNPTKTAEAIGPDGFMRTGDVGRLDEDGYLHVVGRVKELIPTHRGFNVAPRDIEEVLYQHIAIGQAAVVGITHPNGTGDMIVAWVTPKEGCTVNRRELLEHCVKSGMPEWQLPELFQVSEKPLPVISGKIAKRILQTPEYAITKLTESIEDVSCKAPKSDDWFNLAREVFERIDGKQDGVLDHQELTAVFKDQGEHILEFFDRPDDGDNVVDHFGWIAGFSKMKPDERIAWLTQASSVLATHERKEVLRV